MLIPDLMTELGLLFPGPEVQPILFHISSLVMCSLVRYVGAILMLDRKTRLQEVALAIRSVCQNEGAGCVLSDGETLHCVQSD